MWNDIVQQMELTELSGGWKPYMYSLCDGLCYRLLPRSSGKADISSVNNQNWPLFYI